jgi:hypothetical protein
MDNFDVIEAANEKIESSASHCLAASLVFGKYE